MEKRKSHRWLHLVLYAAVISVTIYAVLGLEYPRFGLIRLTEADKALVQLRDSIHQPFTSSITRTKRGGVK